MGLLATGTSCLALVWVIGRSRVPAPPARISAFTPPSRSRSLLTSSNGESGPEVDHVAGGHFKRDTLGRPDVEMTMLVDRFGPPDDRPIQQLDAHVAADRLRRRPGRLHQGQPPGGLAQLGAAVLQMN